MNLHIPTEALWLVGGYIAGRAVEGLIAFLLYLDRETRGYGATGRRPPKDRP